MPPWWSLFRTRFQSLIWSTFTQYNIRTNQFCVDYDCQDIWRLITFLFMPLLSQYYDWGESEGIQLMCLFVATEIYLPSPNVKPLRQQHEQQQNKYNKSTTNHQTLSQAIYPSVTNLIQLFWLVIIIVFSVTPVYDNNRWTDVYDMWTHMCVTYSCVKCTALWM